MVAGLRSLALPVSARLLEWSGALSAGFSKNNIQGYTVIVVAVNRRIAVNIYKYLVGAWNALYEKARDQLYITRRI